MSPARLRRFSRGYNGDAHDAFRVFMWNAELCEAFYIPLHISEIAIRNSVNNHICSLYGPNWLLERSFCDRMPDFNKRAVDSAISNQSRIRGRFPIHDEVLAAVTFGFWVHLFHRRYKNILWHNGIEVCFPNAPRGLGLQNLFNHMELRRDFRNEVFHHQAIYDRRPLLHLDKISKTVEWICRDTQWLLSSRERVNSIMQKCPVRM